MPRTTPALLVVLSLGFLAPALQAQNDADRAFWKVQLGEKLFHATELSGNGKLSCASCHVPGQAFTNGEVEAEGILGTGAGRNVPTLLGIAGVAHFPVAEKTGKGFRIGTADFSERCLAPIENPLEMGGSIAEVVRRLRADGFMRQAFELAYGPAISPVTPKRIGDALAAFIVAFEAGETPHDAFLAGDREALTIIEKLGARAFDEVGCASCHAGPGFTDGLMHVAFTPEAERARKQAARGASLAREAVQRRNQLDLRFPREGSARALFEALEESARQAGGGDCGGMESRRPQRSPSYGGSTPGVTIEMQTLTLLDVARTAPYFRDGSETDLEAAVRRHVEELVAVRAQAQRIDAFLTAQRDARPPRELRATQRPPAELARVGELEIMGITAFLRTLSPDRGATKADDADAGADAATPVR